MVAADVGCGRNSTRPPSRPSGSTASHTSTGATFPFALTGAWGRKTIARSVAPYVVADEYPVDRRRGLDRAAVFITSPATIDSPASGRASSGDERFSRRDAYRHVEIECCPARSGPRSCRAPRAPPGRRVRDRPRGCRRAVHGDHGVADELLDCPAVALEVPPQRLVVATQQRPDVLGVELLGARRGADEVDEDCGDDLPLFLR